MPPTTFPMGYYETGDGTTREVRLTRLPSARGAWVLIDAIAATDADARVVTRRLHDVEEATDTADDYLDLARTLRRPVDELWS